MRTNAAYKRSTEIAYNRWRWVEKRLTSIPKQAGRVVQVLSISGAAADHPFLLHVPEGRYLKAVFCRVE